MMENKIFNGLKKTLLNYARHTNQELNNLKKTVIEIDKKVDRVIYISTQTAMEMNLHKKEHINLQENCRPRMLINGHIQQHKEMQEKLERKNLTTWQKVQITIGAIGGITGIVIAIINLVRS